MVSLHDLLIDELVPRLRIQLVVEVMFVAVSWLSLKLWTCISLPSLPALLNFQVNWCSQVLRSLLFADLFQVLIKADFIRFSRKPNCLLPSHLKITLFVHLFELFIGVFGVLRAFVFVIILSLLLLLFLLFRVVQVIRADCLDLLFLTRLIWLPSRIIDLIFLLLLGLRQNALLFQDSVQVEVRVTIHLIKVIRVVVFWAVTVAHLFVHERVRTCNLLLSEVYYWQRIIISTLSLKFFALSRVNMTTINLKMRWHLPINSLFYSAKFALATVFGMSSSWDICC